VKNFTIMLITAVLLLGGCNTPSVDQNNAGGRVFVDQKGAAVTVPDEVNRIICSVNPMVKIVFAAGAQGKIIGTDTKSFRNPFLQSIHPGIAGAKSMGDRSVGFNPEMFAAMKPDVVFFHSGFDETVRQLRSLNVPTVVLVPETRDDMLNACILVGDIAGTKNQAEKVVAEFERLERLVRNRLEDIPEKDRVKAYMTGNDTLTVQTGDMYQHYLIEAAGGINPGSSLRGAPTIVSPEQVAGWNPDFIFVIAGNADSAADVLANAQLAQVKAVMDKNVYKVPSARHGSWDYPEPISICAMVWMASLMYPERMADVDVLQTINDFYRLIYGKTYIELGGSAGELVGK